MATAASYYDSERILIKLTWTFPENPGKQPITYRVAVWPECRFMIERFTNDGAGDPTWRRHDELHDIPVETIISCALRGLAKGNHDKPAFESTAHGERVTFELGSFPYRSEM